MYGFKTLDALNKALREVGVGRYQITEDEWKYGISSTLAYTFAYLNLDSVMRKYRKGLR